MIVFWLVWWAWTQFTWALNSADTTHPGVEAVMLVATAIAFLMAVTIPDAFGDAGGWFATTYIAVRVVGLALYGRVAWDDVAKRAAVRRFALRSAGGLAAVAIVAGAGLTGVKRTTQIVAVGILAVAVTCGLWWSYFVTSSCWARRNERQERVEASLSAAPSPARSAE